MIPQRLVSRFAILTTEWGGILGRYFILYYFISFIIIISSCSLLLENTYDALYISYIYIYIKYIKLSITRCLAWELWRDLEEFLGQHFFVEI